MSNIEVHHYSTYRLYIEPNEDRPGNAVTVVAQDGSSASLEFLDNEGTWSDGPSVELPVPCDLVERIEARLERLGVER